MPRGISATMSARIACGAGLVLSMAAISVSAYAQATPQAPTVDISERFDGEWDMQGRFRFAPDADWIPTRSRLTSAGRLGGNVVVRDITAPQIDFSALDLITYNPETGVAQYIYVNNESTTALWFEGSCTDAECMILEFAQVCGPSWGDAPCTSRSTITFESLVRFVARDFYPAPDGTLYLGREVTYTKPGGV